MMGCGFTGCGLLWEGGHVDTDPLIQLSKCWSVKCSRMPTECDYVGKLIYQNIFVHVDMLGLLKGHFRAY